ncbi:MAG: helix-turn-helix domain-containing protein [Sphingomonadales bacterium]|nr:MAG: helix-turn-helix domain-containing protein [Sphingomonadales bacterium]
MYDVRDVANQGRTGFTSLTKVVRFGASVLGRGRSVGQTFVRDAQLVRRSGLDHVSITVNLSDGVGDFNGVSARSGGGSIQFRDLARPSISTTSAVDLINLVVPRHVLPSWLLGRGFHGLTLSGESAGARLIASHLGTLADVADELTDDEGIAAVEATFVIAERFLGQGRAVAPPHSDAIQRTIRRRAMHLFDSAALSRSAGVDDIAVKIGVSRSSLYRAFEPMGGVMAYVRHRRLDRVYAALRAPTSASRSIDELAFRHGFRDRAQLVSAFQKRFACSPQDVRPSTLGNSVGSGVNARGEMDRAAHDVFIDWLRVGEAV